MRPLTEDCPKMLLEVAGEPFAAHQLRWLAGQGIRRVVIAVGFLGHMIVEFVGDGAAFGLDVSYSFDGAAPLGTGGALRQAVVEHELDGPVLTMYGDSYLSVKVDAVLAAARSTPLPALMVVFRNHDSFEPSNASFDGHLVRYDKHRGAGELFDCIDYGLSVFDAGWLRTLPAASWIDLAEVQADLAKRSLLAGYEATERFYEIGSPAGLAALSALLAR
jgi:NDP-sugar pyrophosphorylase family protein